MDDHDKIAAWMSAQGLGEGPLENVAAIGGGTQNIMLRFERDGRDVRAAAAGPRTCGRSATR